jgi:hypothetical protein
MPNEPGYYDRQGKRLTTEEWARRMETLEYKRVAMDTVGTKRISTVWLGLNHNYFDNGLPLIFETMVFEGESWEDEECVRYSTEAEAIEGHRQMVAKYQGGEA